MYPLKGPEDIQQFRQGNTRNLKILCNLKMVCNLIVKQWLGYEIVNLFMHIQEKPNNRWIWYFISNCSSNHNSKFAQPTKCQMPPDISLFWYLIALSGPCIKISEVHDPLVLLSNELVNIGLYSYYAVFNSIFINVSQLLWSSFIIHERSRGEKSIQAVAPSFFNCVWSYH